MKIERTILSRPFPRPESPTSGLYVSIGTGAFISLFLLVFTPFGLHEAMPRHWPVVAGYGVVTTLAMILVAYVLPRLVPTFFAEEVWTTGKEILEAITTILLIAVGNNVYSAWMFGMVISPTSIIVFILFTAAIGIIPSTVIVLWRFSVLTRRYTVTTSESVPAAHREHHGRDNLASPLPTVHTASAPEVSESEATVSEITLSSDDTKVSLRILETELLVMTAADNYVEIRYRRKGVLRTELVRTSLRSLEERTSFPPTWWRCHRSHIVNTTAVRRISGTAQGYRLHVEDGISVPVARSKSAELRTRRADMFSADR